LSSFFTNIVICYVMSFLVFVCGSVGRRPIGPVKVAKNEVRGVRISDSAGVSRATDRPVAPMRRFTN